MGREKEKILTSLAHTSKSVGNFVLVVVVAVVVVVFAAHFSIFFPQNHLVALSQCMGRILSRGPLHSRVP